MLVHHLVFRNVSFSHYASQLAEDELAAPLYEAHRANWHSLNFRRNTIEPRSLCNLLTNCETVAVTLLRDPVEEVAFKLTSTWTPCQKPKLILYNTSTRRKGRASSSARHVKYNDVTTQVERSCLTTIANLFVSENVELIFLWLYCSTKGTE